MLEIKENQITVDYKLDYLRNETIYINIFIFSQNYYKKVIILVL